MSSSVQQMQHTIPEPVQAAWSRLVEATNQAITSSTSTTTENTTTEDTPIGSSKDCSPKAMAGYIRAFLVNQYALNQEDQTHQQRQEAGMEAAKSKQLLSDISPELARAAQELFGLIDNNFPSFQAITNQLEQMFSIEVPMVHTNSQVQPETTVKQLFVMSAELDKEFLITAAKLHGLKGLPISEAIKTILSEHTSPTEVDDVAMITALGDEQIKAKMQALRQEIDRINEKGENGTDVSEEVKQLLEKMDESTKAVVCAYCAALVIQSKEQEKVTTVANSMRADSRGELTSALEHGLRLDCVRQGYNTELDNELTATLRRAYLSQRLVILAEYVCNRSGLQGEARVIAFRKGVEAIYKDMEQEVQPVSRADIDYVKSLFNPATKTQSSIKGKEGDRSIVDWLKIAAEILGVAAPLMSIVCALSGGMVSHIPFIGERLQSITGTIASTAHWVPTVVSNVLDLGDRLQGQFSKSGASSN